MHVGLYLCMHVRVCYVMSCYVMYVRIYVYMYTYAYASVCLQQVYIPLTPCQELQLSQDQREALYSQKEQRLRELQAGIEGTSAFQGLKNLFSLLIGLDLETLTFWIPLICPTGKK